MTKKVVYVSVGVLGVALIGGGFMLRTAPLEVGMHAESGAVNRVPVGGDVLWADDFSDDRRLVGSSHNVFVGRIVDKLGTKLITEGIPWTQFSVDVVMNIKGNLNGTIVINQLGGNVGGKPFMFDDVVPLLKPGNTYLLTTGFVNGEYHMNGHPNASKVLSENASARRIELRSIAEGDKRVRELGEAYRVEILPRKDIVRNTAFNAYTARCLDATGELIDDTVQLSREKEGLPEVECVTALTPEGSAALTPTVSPARTPGPTPIEPDLPVFPTVKPPPPLPTL